MINGYRPDSSMFDAAMNSCMKRIAEDPNLVLEFDAESGFPYVVTKEEHQKMLDFFEAVKPDNLKVAANLPGKIIVFGTGGDIENDKNFTDLFFKNQR